MSSRTSQTLLGHYVKKFLGEYLSVQRDCSPNTICAYRDALSIFLRYLDKAKKVRPETASIADLSAANVLGFLNDMQATRKNGAPTRNARLAAIRALVRYILMLDPTLSADLQPVLAVPSKRTHRKVLGYLTKKETDAVLEGPSADTWSGRRDRVLFLTMYNSGARASEIIRVKVADIRIDKVSSLGLHGKGRKERVLPLWKKTARALRKWIDRNRISGSDFLFANTRGLPLTRSGIAKRLAKAVASASAACPSLRRPHISPHSLRHTIAMHLLQSGVDITVVSMWLGHEDVETTHLYLTSDMTMKEKGLDALHPPTQRRGRFRPKDKLLAFLESI